MDLRVVRLEQGPKRRRFLPQLVDHGVFSVAPDAAAQRSRHRAVLGLQIVEHVGELRQGRGHGQQPEGVARRRRIHHDFLESARQPAQLDQPHQLVDAGQRKAEQGIDVFVVEIRTARRDHPE